MSGYHFERCERQVKTEAHYCVETDGYRQKKAQGWLVLEQRRKAEEEERLRMRGEAHVFEEGDVAVCKEGEADMRCSVVAVVEVESVSASKARQREFVGRLQHCAVVFARSHRGQLGNEVPEGCLDVNHRFKGRRVYWTTNDELVPVQVEKMDELRLLELPLPFLVRLFVHLSTLDGLQLALSCQRLHGVRNLELHWHCAPSNRVFVATSLPGSFYVDRPLVCHFLSSARSRSANHFFLRQPRDLSPVLSP